MIVYTKDCPHSLWSHRNIALGYIAHCFCILTTFCLLMDYPSESFLKLPTTTAWHYKQDCLHQAWHQIKIILVMNNNTASPKWLTTKLCPPPTQWERRQVRSSEYDKEQKCFHKWYDNKQNSPPMSRTTKLPPMSITKQNRPLPQWVCITTNTTPTGITIRLQKVLLVINNITHIPPSLSGNEQHYPSLSMIINKPASNEW